MNVIKFRGKRIDNGEVVFGYVYEEPSDKDKWRILDFDNEWDFSIAPKSLAQFVGYDKNGDEFYSDDTIVEEIFPGAVPQKYFAGDRIPVNRIGENFFNYELVKGGKK